MPKEMEMRKKKSVGFTLIELLIVVAIIGILAAIAVPNFLEAQVRAKVARSQADMRTIATGLETYYVDYNKYPEPEQTNYDPSTYLIPLTTPVAMLAEIPEYAWAPFKIAMEYDPVTGEVTKWKESYAYRYEMREYWEKSLQTGIDDGWGTSETLLSWRMFDENDRKMWYLAAVGPDGEQNEQQAGSANFGCMALEYDTTNGSVSKGDIIRMGP